MEKIRARAAEELKAFLERSEEDLNNFIAKVQIFADVLTEDYAEEIVTTHNEISVVLLAKTPNGLQVAYNNTIVYDPTKSEEDIFKLIKDAFPTKEEIVKAKEEAAKQEAARKEFQERMQNLNPQEVAELMANEANDIVSEAEGSESSPE